jgi:hypothetical protein
MEKHTGYGSLLKASRFQAFFWTQFLGAFNDNVYKMIVSLVARRPGAGYSGVAGGRVVGARIVVAGE